MGLPAAAHRKCFVVVTNHSSRASGPLFTVSNSSSPQFSSSQPASGIYGLHGAELMAHKLFVSEDTKELTNSISKLRCSALGELIGFIFRVNQDCRTDTFRQGLERNGDRSEHSKCAFSSICSLCSKIFIRSYSELTLSQNRQTSFGFQEHEAWLRHICCISVTSELVHR